ncbi:hypothetical protein BVG94_25380 (plasmid) [Serratia marcescens]|uniref:hypothetical protein n=1 Tax=Serratia marcescens TaxID=615 RepID=UPI000B5FBAAF|nr:hypothetical protein BVG94_25380 [Serratia marcescens]
MYIPRPAKLLFQHDDGWSRYLDKHGDSLSDWTKLAVERMLANRVSKSAYFARCTPMAVS